MAVAFFQGLAPKLLPIVCRFDPNWFYYFCDVLMFVIRRSKRLDAQSTAFSSMKANPLGTSNGPDGRGGRGTGDEPARWEGRAWRVTDHDEKPTFFCVFIDGTTPMLPHPTYPRRIQNPKEARLLISARDDSAATLQPGPCRESSGKAEGRMQSYSPGTGPVPATPIILSSNVTAEVLGTPRTRHQFPEHHPHEDSIGRRRDVLTR